MFFHSKEFVFVALCVISRCLGDEEDTTSGGGGGGGGSQSSSGGGGGGSSGGSGSSGGGGFSSGANWITIGGGGGGGGVTIGTGVGAGGQSFMTVGTGGSAPSVFALGGGGASVAGGAGVVGGAGVAGGAGGAFVSSGGSMMSSAGSGFGQCPWWAPPVICFEPPCFSNPVCPAIRNARCVNNNCGRCSSRFFVGPIEVTAFCNIQQGSYCPPWRPQAYCYVDPCRVNSCPVVPYATCRADYCGGCHARYYLNGYEVTSLCHKHVYPRSQAVSFHQAKPIIAKPIHHTHVTHTHHHYKHHLLHHMHHKSGKVF